jgi:hypothetical protein
MNLRPPLWILVFMLIAGLTDTSTGLLLIARPEFTLGIMGIQSVPMEIVYMQFIGAFVLATGSAYLVMLRLYQRLKDLSLIKTTLILTAWLRLVIGLFVSAAVIRGALECAWIMVAITDGSFALIQIGALRHSCWKQ